MSQASSQERSSWSIRILISSGTAIEGWVSFSWMAASSGNFDQLYFSFLLKRRTMSAREHATKKYCCFSLSSLPI